MRLLETNQTTQSPSNSNMQKDPEDSKSEEEEELPRSKPVVAIVGRSGDGPTGTRSILSQPGGVHSQEDDSPIDSLHYTTNEDVSMSAVVSPNLG